MLEAKSWGTRIKFGTTVGDASCRSMLILVVLLMWLSCYVLLPPHIDLLRTTTNSSVAGYRCLPVAAVAPRQNLTVSWLPPSVWRCLLAVSPVHCLGSLCAVFPDGSTRYNMPWFVYVRNLGWSCVLRSFAILQVCGSWFQTVRQQSSSVSLPSPLPTTTARSLHFYRDKTSALSSLVQDYR